MPTRTDKHGEPKRASRASNRKTDVTRTTKTRSVRLDMRLEHRAKTLIERAASLTGQTVTDFAVSNLVESALATIERHERLVLSNRDRDRFLAALDRPARRLPALIRAARLHTKVSRG